MQAGGPAPAQQPPPGQTQQREFARRIRYLSEKGIPVFLLVGNHDLPNAVGRATRTEIFDTLAVSGVHVSHKPEIFVVGTADGPLQIASLPWLLIALASIFMLLLEISRCNLDSA